MVQLFATIAIFNWLYRFQISDFGLTNGRFHDIVADKRHIVISLGKITYPPSIAIEQIIVFDAKTFELIHHLDVEEHLNSLLGKIWYV